MTDTTTPPAAPTPQKPPAAAAPDPPPVPASTAFQLERLPAERRRLAAIDIGSNSVRIVVARATDSGYQVLDEERENTRLAASLGATGRLSAEAIESTVAALRNFVTMARGHGATTLRAIATSAVRDARNGKEFCRRVKAEVGLDIEIIPPREEGRLSFLSVARAFDVSDKAIAVADIGGGSTEIVLAASGVVEAVYATRLGAVRVSEACDLAGLSDEDNLERAENYIDAELRRAARKPALVPAMLYGTGGTFTALAAIDMARGGADADATPRGYRVNRAQVRHHLADLARLTLEERRGVPGLNPRRADIIVAGLLVIERVLRHFGVNEVQVHTGGVRDGLLLTMVRDSLSTGPVTAAERREGVERFAERCGCDLNHARQAAWIAGRLLDALAEPLSIDPADKPLLEDAALLANVGYLINYDGHHKHSYHLIINSDLPGFERDELRLVANVARYHRGSAPKQKHRPFGALSDHDQDRVAKLAAILRVSLALDRTHQQRARDVAAEVTDAAVHITLRTDGDAEVDLWAARRKVDLFERVFGRRVYFAAT